MGPKRPQKAEAAKGRGFLGSHSVPCWFCLPNYCPSFLILGLVPPSPWVWEKENVLCGLDLTTHPLWALGLLSNAKVFHGFLRGSAELRLLQESWVGGVSTRLSPDSDLLFFCLWSLWTSGWLRLSFLF